MAEVTNKTEFVKEIGTLKEKFERIKTHTDKVPLFKESNDIKQFYHTNERLIESLDNPIFQVCLAGRLSAGKTFLLKYILGKENIGLKSEETATTAVPTYIRHGEEKAIVHYMSADKRKELLRDYIDDIAQSHSLSEERREELKSASINALSSKLNKVKEESLNDGKRLSDSFKYIEILIKKWKHKVGQSPNVTLEQAFELTNKNEESVVLDRIDLFLPDLPYDENIILVDLPGVGAENIRHEKETQKLVLDPESKAFVFVFETTGVDDGTFSKLISIINNKKQSVSDSFWILNKWNEDSENQKLDEHFKGNLSKGGINILDSRFFIAPRFDGMPSDEFKEAVNTIKIELFRYLTTDVYQEFKDKIERKYRELTHIIKQLLVTNSDVTMFDHDKEIFAQRHLIASEIFEKWKQKLEKDLKEVHKLADQQIVENPLFSEENINQAKDTVDSNISTPEAIEFYDETSRLHKNDHEKRWTDLIKYLMDVANPGEVIREILVSNATHEIYPNLQKNWEVVKLPISHLGITFSLPETLINRIENILGRDKVVQKVETIVDVSVMDYTENYRKEIERKLQKPAAVNQASLINKAKSEKIKDVEVPSSFEEIYNTVMNDANKLKDQAEKIAKQHPELLKSKKADDNVSYAVEFVKAASKDYLKNKREFINKTFVFSIKNLHKEIREKLFELTNDNIFSTELRHHIGYYAYDNFSDKELEMKKREIEAIKELAKVVGIATPLLESKSIEQANGSKKTEKSNTNKK